MFVPSVIQSCVAGITFLTVYFSAKAIAGIKIGKRIHFALTDVKNREQERSDLTLGKLERWYASRHRAGNYNNFGVACQLRGYFPCTGPVLDALVQRFLRSSPCLRFVLDEEGIWPPKFRELDVSLCEPHVSFSHRDSDESWQQILQQEHRVPFQTGGSNLLWRLHIVSSTDGEQHEVLLLLHHVVADGMTGAFLLRKLLECIECAVAPLPKMRVMEELLDVRPTVGYIFKRYIIKEKLLELFPWFRQLQAAWLGDGADIPVQQRDSEAIFVEIDGLEALQTACRKRKTTVHGALVAAACCGTLAASARTVIASCQSALNLRDLAKAHPNQEGNCISASIVNYTSSPTTSFWHVAKEAKERITAWKPQSVELIGLTDFIDGDWVDFHRKVASRPPSGRDNTMVVSNLGNHPFKSQYQFAETSKTTSVEGVWFSAANTHEGPVFVLNCISVNGKLTVSIYFVKGVVTSEQATQFSRAFVHALNICKKGQGKNFYFKHVLDELTNQRSNKQ